MAWNVLCSYFKHVELVLPRWLSVVLQDMADQLAFVFEAEFAPGCRFHDIYSYSYL